MKKVIIEQSEIISPLGNLQETTGDLIDGACAIQKGPCFDLPIPFAPFQDLRYRDLAYCVSRLKEEISFSDITPESTIFIYCAAKGDIRSMDEMIQLNTPAAEISPLLDKQAQTVCDILGLTPAHTLAISNACASGAIGIETALEMLDSEQFTHAVIFGFDSLSRFVTTGFHALGALSDTCARPFDAQRDGLTMGEGTGVAILSHRTPYEGDIIIAGAGSSNDANHRTGPSRTGDGLYNAAKAACDNASLPKEAIGAVKCHGTATPFNDAMEARALHLLFGEVYPPCASFKGAIGHLSGAGSLVEILITAECIKRSTLPPTIGYENSGVEEPIPIANHSQPIEKPVALCLSAGFGGLNAAVIIEEHI